MHAQERRLVREVEKETEEQNGRGEKRRRRNVRHGETGGGGRDGARERCVTIKSALYQSPRYR
jgi:hypothetical protein